MRGESGELYAQEQVDEAVHVLRDLGWRIVKTGEVVDASPSRADQWLRYQILQEL